MTAAEEKGLRALWTPEVSICYHKDCKRPSNPRSHWTDWKTEASDSWKGSRLRKRSGPKVYGIEDSA